MSAAEQLARQLDRALHDADQNAVDARHTIMCMRDQHANLVVVLDGLREAIKDATWGDFGAVLDSLTDAAAHLGEVTAREDARWAA